MQLFRNINYALSLATWLLVFGCLGSCESPDQLGQTFDEDLLKTIFTDTISIETDITLGDSVNTTSSPNLLFGGYTDPELGNSQFEFYAELGFAEDSVQFVDRQGNLATFDSLIIYLPVVTVNGDSVKKQTIDVFRVTDRIGSTNTYYQFSTLRYDPTPIGTAVYPTQMSDRLNFSQLRDEVPSLRIKVREDLAREIFSKSGKMELSKDSLFREFFRGIRVASREKDAAILSFPATFGGSGSQLQIVYIGMLMHYHYTVSTKVRRPNGTEVDTTFIENKSKGFGFNFNRFLNVKYDFSSSKFLKGLVPGGSINTKMTNNMGYILNGVGLTTRIRFPHLKQLVPSGRVMINKADLRLIPDPSTISRFRTAPSSLQFIKLDARGRESILSDGSLDILLNEISTTPLPLNMLYIPNGRAYTNAQMTFYVQRILDGTEPNNGLVIAPSGNSSTSNRLLFYDNAHPSLRDRLQLRVYYTKVE
ncbi:MAG: DUF4270 family protein [Cytophagales bacterium]|nr:MAG: DUF4270 family protein [Cytophagales bacterium]TAF62279.1 MAG: DUF4270 family protein [Cytophagales bacterium]